MQVLFLCLSVLSIQILKYYFAVSESHTTPTNDVRLLTIARISNTTMGLQYSRSSIIHDKIKERNIDCHMFILI